MTDWDKVEQTRMPRPTPPSRHNLSNLSEWKWDWTKKTLIYFALIESHILSTTHAPLRISFQWGHKAQIRFSRKSSFFTIPRPQ